METREFNRELVMKEILTNDELVKVNEPYQHHRYWLDFLLIFEHDGMLWQTIYQKPFGETEDDELPFRYGDNMECVRVFEKPVITVEYVTEDPDNVDLDALEQENSN